MKKLYINKSCIRVIVLVVFLFTVSNLISQNRYLFINQHTVYEEFEPIVNSGYVHHAIDNKPFNFLAFSITRSNTNNRKFSELTFMPISISKKEVNTRSLFNSINFDREWLRVQMHLSYHLSYLLRKEKIIIPYIGWGVKVYGKTESGEPVVSSIYSKYTTGYGFQGLFIVGVKTKLSNQLYFNAQLPYSFFDYSVNYEKIAAPFTLEGEKNNKNITLQPFPATFYFKIGVGLLLKTRKDKKS